MRAELVTTSLFSTLGARAMFGRTIARRRLYAVGDRCRRGVVSEPLWRRQFGGDTAVIGTTAVLDKLPVTIIGVMPASFTGIRESAEMWVPFKARERAVARRASASRWKAGWARWSARLAPNVSLATADAQLKAAAQTLNASLPPPAFGPRKADWSGGAVGFAEARQHPLIRPLLLVLSIAVGGVLADRVRESGGLLLARARAREAELGVRIALGAGRGRLVRQTADGERGARAARRRFPASLIAYGGAAALARLRPTLPPNYVLLRSVDLLQGVSLAPDWRVVAFATLLTVDVGMLFGAAPAFARIANEHRRSDQSGGESRWSDTGARPTVARDRPGRARDDTARWRRSHGAELSRAIHAATSGSTRGTW